MNIAEFDGPTQQGLRRLINSARQCADSGTCFEIPDARRRAVFSQIVDDYYALTVDPDSQLLTDIEAFVQGGDDAALGVVFVPTNEPNHPEHYDSIVFMRRAGDRPDFTKVLVFVENYRRAWVSRGFAHPSSELFQQIEQYLGEPVRGGRRLRHKRKRMTKRRLSRRRQSKKKQMRRH